MPWLQTPTGPLRGNRAREAAAIGSLSALITVCARVIKMQIYWCRNTFRICRIYVKSRCALSDPNEEKCSVPPLSPRPYMALCHTSTSANNLQRYLWYTGIYPVNLTAVSVLHSITNPPLQSQTHTYTEQDPVVWQVWQLNDVEVLPPLVHLLILPPQCHYLRGAVWYRK